MPKKYRKDECYFAAYPPNANGDIKITLRMNTINDTTTYRWVYANIKAEQQLTRKIPLDQQIVSFEKMRDISNAVKLERSDFEQKPRVNENALKIDI